jgi:ATP-binding cassette subfamily B protein
MNRKILNTFYKFTMPYYYQFLIGSLGAFLAVIAQDIIPPYIVSKVFLKIEALYATHAAIKFQNLEIYLVLFLGSMVLGLILWRIQGLYVWKFEINSSRDMIVHIFKHLEHQGYIFHSNRFGGALVSQANKFISAYERMMDELIWSIIPGITSILASFIVLLFVSKMFAFILLGVVIAYIVIMWFRIRNQLGYNQKESIAESERTAALADAITNISNIRTFGNEEYELKRFTKYADNTKQAYSKLSIETFKNESISHFITSGFRVLALFFGIFAITKIGSSASVLYLVISYSSAIMDRIWQFGRVVRNINRSFGDASEMNQILEMEPEIKDSQIVHKCLIHRGGIAFENVNFRHQGSRTNLFKNINLNFKPGEKIGLVGPSGGGKTTITNLLLRQLEIYSGSIKIDGQDIRDISLKDLRQNISYVPQEPILFHRSIKENIAYGNLRATMQMIEAVAKMASADQFINDLPNGYDTLVGERGVKLSGGQRQRIVIARAMLKNAPILILDEATSALDSASEEIIQSALWKLMDNRTTLVIAHRLSTIQGMDKILVLDKGKVSEFGTHNELILKNGLYKKLWQKQSGGFLK